MVFLKLTLWWWSMLNPWQLVVLGICFAMLFGLVGSYDYEDAQASAKLYCDMTTEGSWPSFNEAIDCSYQDDEN
jgi:hypothetical protein